MESCRIRRRETSPRHTMRNSLALGRRSAPSSPLSPCPRSRPAPRQDRPRRLTARKVYRVPHTSTSSGRPCGICRAWAPTGRAPRSSRRSTTSRRSCSRRSAGEIYVINAKTGQELPGWPQWVHIHSSTPTGVDSSPAVAYLDGPDRPPSIIVGAGSLWRRNQQGGLEAFYASGKVRFVFQTQRTFNPWGSGPNDYSDPVFATPAVGDITGSGQQDIVFGSYDHNIYALQPDGHLVAGFPINRADTIWSSPTLADTSHTGRDDIIMGGDSSGLDGCYGGWIVDYRYIASAPAPNLAAVRRPDHLVEPDGRNSQRHRATGGRRRYQLEHATTQAAPPLARSSRSTPTTASNVPGWPVTANGPTFGSPAIGRDRRPDRGRRDVVRPLPERPGDRECLERVGTLDLVEGIRGRPRSHLVSGSRRRHGRSRRGGRRARRRRTGTVDDRGQQRELPVQHRCFALRCAVRLRYCQQSGGRLRSRRSGKRLDALPRLRRADGAGEAGRIPVPDGPRSRQPAGMARMEGERGPHRHRGPALGAANELRALSRQRQGLSPRDE